MGTLTDPYDDETRVLRIESKFKNARLYNAISDASVPLTGDYNRTWSAVGKIKAFCDLHQLPLSRVYQLINLKLNPLSQSSGQSSIEPRPLRIRPLCVQLATLLEKDVAWLFPKELYEIEWPTVLIREVDPHRFRSLAAAKMISLPASQEHNLIISEDNAAIEAVLKTLKPRETQLLRLRFGIGDCKEHTLEELARLFDISTERVRQIEARALRKLRHPSRTRKLPSPR